MEKQSKSSPLPVLQVERLPEVRSFPVDVIELHVDTEVRDGKSYVQRYVEGIGVVYDKEVEIWDGYYEKIRSGAFDRWLEESAEIKSFFNHNPDYVLSTTRSTPKLVIENTPTGLRFSSPIPNTSYGRDLVDNLMRKNIRGASFAFYVPKNGDIWTQDKKGRRHREIIQAEIYEIGPVTNPAYLATSVKCRSRENIIAEAQEALRIDMIADDETTGERNHTVNENCLELRRLKLNLLSKEPLYEY